MWLVFSVVNISGNVFIWPISMRMHQLYEWSITYWTSNILTLLYLPKISSDIPVGCFNQVLLRLLTSKVFLSVPSTLALSILECIPFSSTQYRRLWRKQNRKIRVVRNSKQKVMGVGRLMLDKRKCRYKETITLPTIPVYVQWHPLISYSHCHFTHAPPTSYTPDSHTTPIPHTTHTPPTLPTHTYISHPHSHLSYIHKNNSLVSHILPTPPIKSFHSTLLGNCNSIYSKYQTYFSTGSSCISPGSFRSVYIILVLFVPSRLALQIERRPSSAQYMTRSSLSIVIPWGPIWVKWKE